jgi:hypothetical protein
MKSMKGMKRVRTRNTRQVWPVDFLEMDIFLATEVNEVRRMHPPDDRVVVESFGCPAGHQSDPKQTVHLLIMCPDQAAKLADLLQDFLRRRDQRLKRKAKNASRCAK